MQNNGLLHMPCQSSPRKISTVDAPKFCELSNYVDVEIPCFSEGASPC